MSTRTTIRISDLVAMANKMNDSDIEDYFNRWGDSVTPGQAWRMGISSLIEDVMMKANNYGGYSYTRGHEVDETKRHYNVSK